MQCYPPAGQLRVKSGGGRKRHGNGFRSQHARRKGVWGINVYDLKIKYL